MTNLLIFAFAVSISSSTTVLEYKVIILRLTKIILHSLLLSIVQSIMLLIAIFSIFLVCVCDASSSLVHADTTVPAPAPGTCPDGWIEAIEGCFLFHHTG